MISYKIPTTWHEHVLKGRQSFGTTINGDGLDQVVGEYGEIAFGRYLRDRGKTFEHVAKEKRTWDFVCQGERIDVKTQKVNTLARPRPHWNHIIKLEQASHECDIYVFAYLSWPNADTLPTSVHLCRFIDCDLFHGHPERVRLHKGDPWPDNKAKACQHPCFLLRSDTMAEVDHLDWILDYGRVDTISEV